MDLRRIAFANKTGSQCSTGITNSGLVSLLKLEPITKGAKVIKSELMRALNEKLPERQVSDVELAVNCLLKYMVDAFVQGERIEIRGFGCFDRHHRPPRIYRNPKTG